MKPALLCSMLAVLLGQPAQAAPSVDVSMYAVSLVGSPYRLGGSTPDSGLDCSGFVDHVYEQVAGIRLPRDSLAISEATQPLDPADLQPGDLVFFNTLHRAYSHVGIYLGEDRFVHATSSRTGSVMVSSLAAPYWRAHFDGARRVVLPQGAAPDTAAVEASR
ncbi:C40 family peptidase [Thiobacillus sedimenti]|uniref:C40 family peptidase n=1 Tax=Thiobacillus sedimenti TaxID=3110231 RepID=A0ABZ1CIA2_9PROT|nr:C40 family peptidase [Thiobacillus sp. SCUT-2]WRS38022.1 C40 family peptidase [Thiobacillus sp. SCUT-2]